MLMNGGIHYNCAYCNEPLKQDDKLVYCYQGENGKYYCDEYCCEAASEADDLGERQ